MNWPEAFTGLVGCRVPLQQAGMGGVTTPALAAAVAREGGLGMIAAAGMAADDVVAQMTAARDSAGDGACIGVNFLMPFLDEEVLEQAAEAANLVEFFYGDPRVDIVDRAHRFGAIAAWQVGSVEEAEEAAGAGCDVIVVQGREAGGHVRGQTSLLPFVEAVRARIDRPIVAAGGIGSGRAMAAAFRAGADAVRIGTRLVATTEADVHPAYADALVDASNDDTVLTETFAMGWPKAPHRVLRSVWKRPPMIRRRVHRCRRVGRSSVMSRRGNVRRHVGVRRLHCRVSDDGRARVVTRCRGRDGRGEHLTAPIGSVVIVAALDAVLERRFDGLRHPLHQTLVAEHFSERIRGSNVFTLTKQSGHCHEIDRLILSSGLTCPARGAPWNGGSGRVEWQEVLRDGPADVRRVDRRGGCVLGQGG